MSQATLGSGSYRNSNLFSGYYLDERVDDLDDWESDDLGNYLETKERAEGIDAKIEHTDQLIDEIVYELYGLTDEEIEIVEEAVG